MIPCISNIHGINPQRFSTEKLDHNEIIEKFKEF